MKASVFIGTSVDGFIARANGDLDFLPPGGGEPHGYDEFMRTIDVLVIGRKTRRPARGGGGANVRGSGRNRHAARRSRHQSHLRRWRITIQRFLQAGLIHLIITRVPVLIGTGIPLFGPVHRDIVFTHVGTRQYASGLVQSEYVLAV